MEGNYPVHMGGKPVGTVNVEKQGLYYHILCSCEIPDDTVCRLMLKSKEKTEKIGILIPAGKAFLLEKRIPVKNLSTDTPEFFVSTQLDVENRMFVPICAEEPFAYLSRLQEAFLGYQDGCVGIWLPK